MMTFADVKATAHSQVEKRLVTLEWTDDQVKMILGSALSKVIDFKNNRLSLSDESVDEIVLTRNTDFENKPDIILSEAKRVLKKNGKIIISFYNDSPQGFFARWFNRIKPQNDASINHMKLSIDEISHMINHCDLLIDKNFVVENDIVFFEVIKLEHEKLGRLIWT